MGTNGEPYIWGYVQALTDQQAVSLEEQVKAIQERAQILDGTWVYCRVEHPSQAQTQWGGRLEFKKLLWKMRTGDVLVLWELAHIERYSPIALSEALAYLNRIGISVRVLHFAGAELALDGEPGRAFAMVAEHIARMFAKMRQDSVRHALAKRKEHGRAYNRFPGFGRKRVVKDGIKYDRWYKPECQQIREIKFRHDRGESIQSIAEDYHRRRERTASNKFWVKRYGWKRKLNTNRVRAAYRWYTSLLESGRDLWDITRKYAAEDFEDQEL